MLEDRRLKTFVTVARLGSFSRAAEALYVTQSTVTARMADLEGALGCPLFKREGRGVTLTETGRTFLPYAQRALQTLEDARAAVVAAGGLGGSVLRIMACHVPAAHDLPHLVQAYLRGLPERKEWAVGAGAGFPLTIETAPSKRIYRKMLQGDVDIGLVQVRFRHPELETTIVMERSLVAVARPDRAQAVGKSLTIVPVAENNAPPRGAEHTGQEAPVFFLQEELEDTLTIRSVCHQLGLDDGKCMGIGDMTALKALLVEGMGIGIVPKVSVASELAAGLLVELAGQMAPALPKFLTCLLVRIESLKGPGAWMVERFRASALAYYRHISQQQEQLPHFGETIMSPLKPLHERDGE